MNHTYEVKRVKNQRPDFLRYLDNYNLTPGAKVELKRREPFDGPLTLTVNGTDITLGFKIAKDILVAPDE